MDRHIDLSGSVTLVEIFSKTNDTCGLFFFFILLYFYAREADRVHNHTHEGTVGPVERKLVELGEVHGIVAGNFGEVSEQTHSLMASLATSRMRVAGPSRGGEPPEERGGREGNGHLCPETAPGQLGVLSS